MGAQTVGQIADHYADGYFVNGIIEQKVATHAINKTFAAGLPKNATGSGASEDVVEAAHSIGFVGA